jgi:hypothetical protein
MFSRKICECAFNKWHWLFPTEPAGMFGREPAEDHYHGMPRIFADGTGEDGSLQTT